MIKDAKVAKVTISECSAMEFTGERMVPEGSDASIFWEHIYRYRFAAKLAFGKRVLDIACGEGYGSAALKSAGARTVIGVDVSPEAVDHARRKYGVDARIGDAESIPLPEASIDLVVSFETMEHVPSPSAFAGECHRVLVPGGLLIVSTPNRSTYTYRDGTVTNPYHCSELTEPEFVALLSECFVVEEIYHQRPVSVPWYGLRQFAAERSAYAKVPGFKQVRGALRRLLCPDFDDSKLAEFGRDPISATLRGDRPLTGLRNPYVLSRASAGSRDAPMYLVAVARKA